MPQSRILISAIVLLLSFATTQQSAQAQGPGTEMTKIINRMGLGSDCGRCQALANQMDQNGSQWVLQNRSHIAQRTISNAENLGHHMGPIRRAGVHAMIRTAVRRSR